VAAVQETFNDVANRYAALQGELEDALEAVERAKEADAQKAADAFLDGKPTPKVLDAQEREALAKVAGLRAALSAAAAAVDSAGNKLVRSIPAEREAWLGELRAKQAATTERYLAAVAEARAAFAELVPLHGAAAWLERFDAGQALAGRDRGWHGRGQLRVDGEGFGPYRDEQNPAKLLELAAKVGAPRQPQSGIKHGPANVVKS
jgi:hypothetical protein